MTELFNVIQQLLLNFQKQWKEKWKEKWATCSRTARQWKMMDNLNCRYNSSVCFKT